METNFVFFDETTRPEDFHRVMSEGKARGKRLYPIVNSHFELMSIADSESFTIVPLSSASISLRESEYVNLCLKSGWVSSTGSFVPAFEEALSRQIGLSHPLAVSNGTAAITLALLALGVGSLPGGSGKSPEEFEVILPSLTFGGSANGVVFAGATPVFADIDKSTWALSVESVSSVISERTRAVLVVHLYGNPADTLGLSSFCRDRGLLLVEDCAEALGSTIGEHHVGFHSDAATFSFFANKTITTGEGGMVFFRDPEAFGIASVLRNQGMNPTRKYWHDSLGFNCRMTNLQAALGFAQTERFTDLIREKIRIGELYENFLRDCNHWDFMPSSPFGKSSRWLIPGLVDNGLGRDTGEVLRLLRDQRIDARAVFPPLHDMPAYQPFRRSSDLSVTSRVARDGICLPSFVGMTDEQVEYVATALKQILR
jgi:perosamine synthetase